MPHHLSEPADLDGLCEAAADVAARIRQESLEDVGSGEEYAGERAYEAELRERVAKVEWKSPPDSPRIAARAYQSRAGIGVKPYLRALFWGLVVGGIGAAIALLFPSFDATTSVILAVVAALIGVLVAIFVVSAAAGPKAMRLGLEAFSIEFARSHGFELEDRYAFHGRYPELPLPGRAHHAMRGRLPSGGAFTLAFCDDTAEMFSHGKRVYLSTDRPLAADVIVAELGVSAGDRSLAEPPPGLQAELHDDTLVVWRHLAGNMNRDRAGLDAFIAQADPFVGSMRPRAG